MPRQPATLLNCLEAGSEVAEVFTSARIPREEAVKATRYLIAVIVVVLVLLCLLGVVLCCCVCWVLSCVVVSVGCCLVLLGFVALGFVCSIVCLLACLLTCIAK